MAKPNAGDQGSLGSIGLLFTNAQRQVGRQRHGVTMGIGIGN